MQFPIKLVRYLSQAGAASRRKCFEGILESRVKINGNTVTEPSTEVTESDKIEFDNKPVSPQKFVYIMLNKPKGYTCTSSDPHAEKKAIDLINLPGYRLFNVGRLDKDSEGLIIFTNDGDFANKLSHPRNNILKTYVVLTTKPLSDENIKSLTTGIEDDGEILKAKGIVKIGPCKYSFVLNEGKKREIRRMIAYCGANVKKLVRVSVGSLKLGSLPSGKRKFISKNDVFC